MRKKAERSETVVIGDVDDALLRECLAVVPGHRTRAAGERAAVAPHHHRKLRIRRRRRCPDVDIETVFARRWRWRRTGATAAATLHAARTKRRRGLHAVPLRGRLRRPPAQRTHRRRREWNALEHTHGGVIARRTRHEPRIRLHRLSNRGRSRRGRRKQNRGRKSQSLHRTLRCFLTSNLLLLTCYLLLRRHNPVRIPLRIHSPTMKQMMLVALLACAPMLTTRAAAQDADDYRGGWRTDSGEAHTY